MFLKMSNGAPISRWLTDGSDHNRNYNFSMWLDNVAAILCYFLVAIPLLKLSQHVYGIKHMLILKHDTFSLLGQPNKASSTVINYFREDCEKTVQPILIECHYRQRCYFIVLNSISYALTVRYILLHLKRDRKLIVRRRRTRKVESVTAKETVTIMTVIIGKPKNFCIKRFFLARTVNLATMSDLHSGV